MADVTVTGLTAARMKEIEAASIVDAELNTDYELILRTYGGQEINVGNIRGAIGPKGNPGTITKVAGKGDDGSGNVPLTAADVGAASKSDLTGLVPIGTIVATGRSAAPTGWLLCQGQAVSRSTYPDLYAAIGVAYGAGDNSTTFNLPDLRGRVPIGRDSTQTEFDTLGERGGSKTHSHGLSSGYALITLANNYIRILRKSVSAWTANVYSASTTNSSGAEISDAASLGGTTDSESTLPPYQVINQMIKY